MSNLWIRVLVFWSVFSLKAGAAEYPDTWWEEVPREQAASWEILPQDASRSKGEVILSKRNELGILSNFAATPFTLDGKTYASLEGFWQMMKYPESPSDPRFGVADWPFTRDQVAQLVAFEAKKAGDFGSAVMKGLSINWVTYHAKEMTYRTAAKGDHYQTIVKATWAKVQQNPKVKEILLRTGQLLLRPDHKQETDASPAWAYYEIYMEIRTQLQQELAKYAQ